MTQQRSEAECSAFGQASHPSFSSFSHIREVSNLSFAVGLREDEAEAELFVQRILPMCRIVPGKPIEKRARATQARTAEVLEVPEILEMRARLEELLQDNQDLVVELREATEKLRDAAESLESVETRSGGVEDELDQCKEQLMEERNRGLAAKRDAESVRQCHADLRDRVSKSEAQVVKLEAELAEKKNDLDRILACSDLEMVFSNEANSLSGSHHTTPFGQAPSKKERRLIEETRMVRALDPRFPKHSSRHGRPAVDTGIVPSFSTRDPDFYARLQEYKQKLHRVRPTPP